METIIPPRLKEGDRIHIIAPSQPLSSIEPQEQKKANERIADYFGAKISFGNVESADVEDRYNDLLYAFENDDINAIFPVTGGYSSNDILSYCHHNPEKGELLWRTIRENPKIFIGASDNSMLNNAIFTKTGLINYYGYHYHNIGVPESREHTAYVQRQLHDSLVRPSDRYYVASSRTWEDELWDLNGATANRRFHNGGPTLLEVPDTYIRVAGRIAIGCVRNLSIMNGTPFQPDFNGYVRKIRADDKEESPEDVILFLEDTMALSAEGLKREFNSLTMKPGWEKVKAVVLGRIPHDHKGAFGERKLKRLGEADEEGLKNLKNVLSSLKAMNALANVAIIATSFDIGHTIPTTLVPVGGWAALSATPQGGLNTELSHTPYIGQKSKIVRRV